MSKTKKEMLMEMFRLQWEEDEKVHKEFGITYEDLIEERRYFYALLDEFGELNHELKSKWCWWKKNVSEPDRAKVLEEFSDVTHFIFSYHLASYGGDIEDVEETIPDDEDELGDAISYIDTDNPIQWIITELLAIVSDHDDSSDAWRELLGFWIYLYMELGLDFGTEVYEPYIKKNAVNQQRVVDGY